MVLLVAPILVCTSRVFLIAVVLIMCCSLLRDSGDHCSFFLHLADVYVLQLIRLCRSHLPESLVFRYNITLLTFAIKAAKAGHNVWATDVKQVRWVQGPTNIEKPILGTPHGTPHLTLATTDSPGMVSPAAPDPQCPHCQETRTPVTFFLFLFTMAALLLLPLTTFPLRVLPNRPHSPPSLVLIVASSLT